MCQFFSGIAFRNGDIKFTEDDSHTTLIERVGLDDSRDLFTRGWVRFEVAPKGDGWEPVRVDETSVPGWWDADRVAFEDRVLAVATRVRPAQAEHKRVTAPARAEYDRVMAPARAEYDRVRAPARAEYDRVRAPARAEYDRVTAPAWAEYVRVMAAAQAEYIATIRTIDGYVPAKEA